jgi:hypothetical protein
MRRSHQATEKIGMFNASSMIRTPACIASCALAMLLASAASAQTIDVSLNVFYADPANINSGGTWEIVAKSSHFGIASLDVRLTNINTLSPPANQGPRGTVNGSDPAGFSIFEVFPEPGFFDVLMAQEPLNPTGGEEQGMFYGVGSLDNGAPNYPGKPPGAMSIGPAFTSLTNVMDVPWAAGDDVFGEPAWNSAALLATGIFNTNVTPAFHTGHSGLVFTTLGNSISYGNRLPATLTTIVRTNFSGTVELEGDYNDDGKVDAADYVVWRKHEGTSTPLPNDPDGGVIGLLQFNTWRANFGAMTMPGGGSGGSAAVPEPASIMLVVAAFVLGLTPRSRR